MDKYLLDTSACIAIIRKNRVVQAKVKKVGRMNCYVSEMTIAELYYGASKSGRDEQFEDVTKILRCFEVVPVYSSLRTYGWVKALLELKGQRIDEMDLLIGSTALYNDMIIVSHNIKHLCRIPNLRLEDWEGLNSN